MRTSIAIPALLAASFLPAADLPYRFLLVISDQWQDPSSSIIEGGQEFNIAAALLKTWGIPFDIIRLDQQRLDQYHLLERDGTSRYGTIVCATGPTTLKAKGVELLPVLVRQFGVNLVVLSDSVAWPELAGLTGIEYVSENRLSDPLTVRQAHFLTREMAGREPELLRSNYVQPGYKVTANSSTVLLSRGEVPFLAVRESAGSGRVVWLGAHRGSSQLGRQLLRDLFKRSLVWAQGYALYAEYPRSVLIEMHDNGNSEKTMSPFWHLRTLSEEQFRASIIEPLKRHKAVVTQVVNTGFVDRETRRVLNPWRQTKAPDYIDPKLVHDYSSTKRGLDAGQKEGVFEINSHGWTHFVPDLDSPPGPLWTAPPDGIGSLPWFQEFADRLRQQEVPAATQRFHMQRSIEYIQHDFGVTPLFLRPSAGAYSPSLTNHTARVAASMGFGLTRLSSPYYLGHDLVVQLGPVVPAATWAFTQPKLGAADVPWTVDGPFFLAFHDRDVAMDAGWFERILAGLGAGVRYMTANEYIGYLHARVSLEAVNPLSFNVEYDNRYGVYFASHKSSWTLHLSDQQRSLTKLPEKNVFEIPAGLGRHRVSAVGQGQSTGRTR